MFVPDSKAGKADLERMSFVDLAVIEVLRKELCLRGACDEEVGSDFETTRKQKK